MSIKMVDMHITIQKAPDVAKPVIAENQHFSVTQQNMAEKFVKESLLNEERVLVVKHTDSEDVNENGSGTGKHRRNGKKQRRDWIKDDKEKKTDADSENSIDISI